MDGNVADRNVLRLPSSGHRNMYVVPDRSNKKT